MEHDSVDTNQPSNENATLTANSAPADRRDWHTPGLRSFPISDITGTNFPVVGPDASTIAS
jgi:hypothetical protein